MENVFTNISYIDTYLEKAIKNKMLPGAVIYLGKGNEELFYKEYGYRRIFPDIEEMRKDTLFDIASLTKVVATWPAIMKLIQEKEISIEQEIREFYGERVDCLLGKVKVGDLL